MQRIISLVYNGDRVLFHVLNGSRSGILDRLMPYITMYGEIWFATFICLVLLLFKEYQVYGMKAAAALLGSNTLVQFVKVRTSRPRPYLADPHCYTLGSLLTDYSFPSGHTCAAFVLSTILAQAVPGAAPIFLTMAFLTGISRIYLGQHYPTDVIVGACLGYLSTVLVSLI